MYRFRGYMTVEASFVVPIVICVFAAIIYFSNYMYDRCVLAQDCYVLAFRAVSSANNDMGADPGGYVMEKSSLVSGNKYFGCSKPFFRAVVKGKTIEVSGHTTVKHSMMGRILGFTGNDWSIDVTQTARKRECPKHIRMVKRLRDIGSKEME